MVSKVYSAAVVGVDAYEVIVEIDDSMGLPQIMIVGLPDQAVKESKDRIRSALMNVGFRVPGKKFTINLAPADVKKEGPAFDLPIALGILANSGYIRKEIFERFACIGELALDGSIRGVQGILSMVLAFEGTGKICIIPYDNFKEAALQKSVPLFPVKHLSALIEKLQTDQVEPVCTPHMPKQKIKKRYPVQFEDIKGQHAAKRALEVAVAGGHNILMIGAPGSGKTLLAKSVTSILPPLEEKELLDIVRIYSVSAQRRRMVFERPFRAPHYTISAPALVGAGTNPRPGEVSLAHHGVLFLDEFAEFPRHVIETLRGPLEDKYVTIARAKQSVTYPARCILICAMNPCPCGSYGDTDKVCHCSYNQVIKYRSKISGPILDRIDIHIRLARIPLKELKSNSHEEASMVVQERITHARTIQRERYKNKKIMVNADLSPRTIKKYCMLSRKADRLSDAALEQLHLSARSYHGMLKLGRTIADLDNSEMIEERHMAEAIQYRSFDREI